MKNVPKISVIIPSFNKVKYIGKTLDSIVDQKYPDLEVIIQDGASTDGTLDIIKRYAKKYPKIIRWESKKDKGQVDAINKGMRKSSGDILAFLNADDIYEKSALSSVAEAFKSHSDAIWFAGQGKVIDGKGLEIAKPVTWYKNILLSINSRFFVLVTNYLMQPSVFLTRRAYKEYGPFSGTKDFVIEYDLWLRLSSKQMPIIVKKNLSKFRIEPDSITKKRFSDILDQDKKIIEKYTNNYLILFLHELNNFGRSIIGKFI